VTLAPGATSADFKPVTLLLNKPVGSGASASDGSAADLLIIANRAAGDHTGMPVLRKHFARLELAAGLETEASGLIVATQDFRIVRKLLGEADKVEMEYVVEVSGALTDDGLKKMNRPWTVDGQSFPAAKVSWQSETRLRVALKTPPAGFIAYMCEEAGLTVLSMKRIRIGRLPMGSLPLGQWRYLLGYERF
jgi:23S rRNA pseudouridine2604 synthase